MRVVSLKYSSNLICVSILNSIRLKHARSKYENTSLSTL
jgi:hypothetical protein